MEKRTGSLLGVLCLQLCGALHTYLSMGAKCYRAEWWQFAPSFYSHFSRVKVETRWNLVHKSQQVIRLELYPIWLFCIQQIFSHDISYSWKMYLVEFYSSSVEFYSSSDHDSSRFPHGRLFCCWVDHVDRNIFVLLHLNSHLFIILFYSLLYPTSWVSCLRVWVWFGERQQQPKLHVYPGFKVSLYRS